MTPLAHQPVGVFDSGVGGLTVLHELLVSLPAEDYLYLGDTARFPYGERTQQELEAFATEIAEYLLAAGAKLLVIACNAASSAALGAVDALLRSGDPARGGREPQRPHRTPGHARDRGFGRL
jgi:glutamate racemase